jgi:hypothetical protein
MFGSVASYVRQHHVGMLALFIALSGTAYAATLPRNSVGTPQLKKDAVTTKKVKNKSLLRKDFKSGQLPAGPAGPKGDPGATSLKVRAVAGSGGTVTANCQPGERATGGGAHSVGGYLDASAPTSHPLSIFVPDGISYQEYTPTSWTAHADDGAGGPADVTAWVICAAP